jgi:hypothetical protein
VDRVRRHRRRAGRGRGHPARREAPRGAAGRPGARLPVRELRRRPHPARARPIGANCLANPRDFLTPWPPTRTATRPPS